MKRGDVYYADLRPVIGSEQGGIRPVLIIQNDVGNKHSPTVICAAITSKLEKAKLPDLEGQEDLTEIIEKVQPLLNEDEAFFQDTMPEYIQRVKDEIAETGVELTTYQGEFRDLGAANVLTGTLASRVYLKQYNARMQAMLEKTFEPLYVMTSAQGLGEYPQEYGNYMWKTLIQNHPDAQYHQGRTDRGPEGIPEQP